MGNYIQTYIDLIALRKLKDNFDRRQIDTFIANFPEGTTDLQILKALCETLYAVHYLAAANDLPLDDAYSTMLMHNKIVKESDDPIEYIFTKYRKGELRKAPSPIHALMQRIEDIEKFKGKEIQSLKEAFKGVVKLLEENGIPLPISQPATER